MEWSPDIPSCSAKGQSEDGQKTATHAGRHATAEQHEYEVKQDGHEQPIQNVYEAEILPRIQYILLHKITEIHRRLGHHATAFLYVLLYYYT